MMYCTQVDLIEQYSEKALVQLTDKTNYPASAIDSAVVKRAIDDACAEIDLYLHGRYRLPLEEIPSVIKRLACTLAFANLHPEGTSDHPAHLRAQEARTTLKGIASHSLSIGLTPKGEAISGNATIQFTAGRNDWIYIW